MATQKFDLKNMDDDEIGVLVADLIDAHPNVIGIIQQTVKNKSQDMHALAKMVSDKFEAKTLVPRDVEALIKALSQQYSVLLGQMNDIENQLMSAESLKDNIMREKNTLRIMTIPIALLIEFNDVIKRSKWAQIKWDEKKGTKCANITDYARIVDVYVEPNSTWETLVNFTFVMGGYISEQAYEELRQISGAARASYYIS